VAGLGASSECPYQAVQSQAVRTAVGWEDIRLVVGDTLVEVGDILVLRVDTPVVVVGKNLLQQTF